MQAELTPEQIAEYTKAHEAAVQKILSVVNAPDWKKDKEDQVITFYKRFEEGNPYAIIKSVVDIPNATIADVENVLLDVSTIDEKTDSKARHGMAQRHLLCEEKDDAEHKGLIYIALLPPGMMVSARDFIIFRRFVDVDGKRIMLNVSVEHPAVPDAKGYVRAVMHYQGYIAEEADVDGTKGVHLTFLVSSDPKGSVPAMLFNSTAVNQGYAAKGIRSTILRAKGQ